MAVSEDAYFKPVRGGWIFAPGLFGFGAFLGTRFATHYRVSEAQRAAIVELMCESRQVLRMTAWLVMAPAILISVLAGVARAQPGGVELIPVSVLVVAALTIATGLVLLAVLTWQFRRELRQLMADAPVVNERTDLRELIRHQAAMMPTHRIVLMLIGTASSATWFATRALGTAGTQDIRLAHLLAAIALALLALRAAALLVAKRVQRTA
jgi:hypothetical protein